MTYAEAIQFLYGLRLFGAKFGLENTFKLAGLAGNPQNQLRFIHVAGTNGKGSTCAMLESIYRTSGLRVGLFTSPHLVSFRERIQVNRQLISEANVVRLTEELRKLSSEFRLQAASGPAKAGTPNHDACPTFFEFITVMALKFFAEQKCDLVVWETGLGGRLDATNIVTPLASVITNVQFDHQQWLGDTLAKIAAEKAGIIKPGVPVITTVEDPVVLAVIDEFARKQNAPLIRVGQASSLSPSKANEKSETGRMPVLPLSGEHQKINAALTLATVDGLRSKIPVNDEAIRTGLSNVNWPGRLQLVVRLSGQRILLDGAHNVAGVAALRKTLEQDFPAAKRTLVLGVLQDKDWWRMCEILAPLAVRIVTVPVSSERTADAQALAAACHAANSSAEVVACDSMTAALERTRDESFVLIAGSLYLVGEALEALGLSPATGGERALNEWAAPVTR